MIELTEKEHRARERVCLALDTATVGEAWELANELDGLVGMFKIGKELHTIACYRSLPVFDMISRFGRIFLDLKFHDAENTVYRASRACSFPGIYMFNVHIAGGEAMCRKAVEGAHDGAATRNIERPRVIGVTVLTSLDDNDLAVQGLGISYDDLVLRRSELAKRWGLDGIVCPANKASKLERLFGPDFLYVTPGIEWSGEHGPGQKQLYTPDRAVKDCSNSILVIGSAITKAKNKQETAYEILQAMAEYS